MGSRDWWSEWYCTRCGTVNRATQVCECGHDGVVAGSRDRSGGRLRGRQQQPMARSVTHD